MMSSLWGSTLKNQSCVHLLGHPGLPLGYPRMTVERKGKGRGAKKLKDRARIYRSLNAACARLQICSWL